MHTLSSTAHHRSPQSASVRGLREHDLATTGERWRTGVNETKTEPKPRRQITFGMDYLIRPNITVGLSSGPTSNCPGG